MGKQWWFFLSLCLLILIRCEEVEQELEVSVDQAIAEHSHGEEAGHDMSEVEEETASQLADCDVFFDDGSCKENFADLQQLNLVNNSLKFFESFLHCSRRKCIEEQKQRLSERLAIGDPIAQYTKKYGMYGYEEDVVEASLYSQFACDAGCALACISEGARLQIGEHKVVNASKILSMVYPVWKEVYSGHFSLFDAIYDNKNAIWPSDLTSIRYEVEDYIDVLKNQLSADVFKETKKSLYLAKESRNLKALAKLLEDDPREQHFIGFMYLEGIDTNRNYTLAEHFFSNLTNPAFNTSYHCFGRGLLHFYGLGMEKNISRGCEFIREASSTTVGVPIFSYYNGLCFLKKRQFKSARDSFIQSAFSQFAPAIDMLLRMKEIGLGGKEVLSVDSFFGVVLLNRLKEHFISIPAEIRTAYAQHDSDRAILYATLCADLGVPYWGSHFIDLFQKHVWKGEPPVFLFSAEAADALYRRFMKSLLSVSSSNEHDVDIATAMVEGKHGYAQDIEKARRMLETSKTADAKYYLGVLNQLPWLGKENIEVSKMSLDDAIESKAHVAQSILYRFRLMVDEAAAFHAEGKWREVLSSVEKLMVLDHRDIVYDENCSILTNIENNVNIDTLFTFLDDKMSEDHLMKENVKKIKKALYKEAKGEAEGEAEGVAEK